MSATTEKLQKVLAARGLGSRRQIERWIADGRVSVNGRRAELGDRVTPEDRIRVDGRNTGARKPPHRHLLYNKPEGELCTRNDPQGRRTVFDRLPRLKNQRWISIGRLDYNTCGLLLFTTDGALANRLMHPSAGIEREYAVRVQGDVTQAALARMSNGVLLDGDIFRFTDIQRPRGREPDQSGANQWYYVVLMEGRNREVRRLWESQGCRVSRLKRVRYGSFFIPSAVKSGQYAALKAREVKELYRLAAAGQAPEPPSGAFGAD